MCKKFVGTTMKKSLFLILVLFSGFTSAQIPYATYTLYTESIVPYAYEENGEIKGLSIDIIDETFKGGAITYKIELHPLKRAFQLTQQRKNTCVFPVQRTQEREVKFKWISPVLITQNAFYTTPASKIKIVTFIDAKGYTIGVHGGSATEEYLQTSKFKPRAVSYDSLNLRMLHKNRIDIWATDTLYARHLSENIKLQIEEKLIYFTSLRALACNLSMPDFVVTNLQYNLIKAYRTKRIKEIRNKYLLD